MKLSRLAEALRTALRPGAQPAMASPVLIPPEMARQAPGDGWNSPSVARRQDAAFQIPLRDMRQGRPRPDFLVAARAVRDTGAERPRILEVGCGSGYYADILGHLLGHPQKYTGLDRSEAMVALARRRHPGVPFLAGDATALPFRDASFDIVMNGNSLMHILDASAAVAEARRVSRRWVMFHTLPTVSGKPTQFLTKQAYGGPVVEIVLGEAEFLALLDRHGLRLRRSYPSVPHGYLEALLGPVQVKTHLCEAR